MRQVYYLTTAIPYVNANPHIGFALEILYADVMARFQRLLGKNVYFLTGTSEHGQKILKAAQAAGIEVNEFVAQKSAAFQELADEWNISHNDFIRTTEERHIRGVQKLWQAAEASGDIYKKSYVGLYCVGCEAFKTEKDLESGKCPIHQTEPEQLAEENYFFRLSKYQEPLEFLFSETKDFVVPPNRLLEVKNMLIAGLEDVSVSRSKEKVAWGIPVPGDEAQMMYVWFNELGNYLTALGYGSADQTKLNTYWPAVHVIGKDINRFHSLLWVAMLISAGLEVPRQIAVHGFLNVNGQKMSKSLNNVIDPRELTRQYPLEAVRYFFMREIPFDTDGNFSHQQFRERYQGDLANGIGNLTYRVLTMMEKYSAGQIPPVREINHALINFLTKETWPAYSEHLNNWRFDRALEAAGKFVSFCDQIISDAEPWALVKAGKMNEVNDLLYHLAEALRHIAVMIWPVLPETAEKIFTQLGLDVALELAKPLAELQQWVELTVGNKIQKAGPLFPRLAT
ncbi:MAG: methionine--tRNA ligase [Candidatus Magasanikbacteria bacterium]|nr:methionine--tRNA ligase [Candidatus Magasanikbacteria bacterium]